MEKTRMKQSLTNRNIQLIALGGAIGTGLFLGSAKAIKLAGPSVLLTYLICGLAVYAMMRAMGDLFLIGGTFQSIGDFIDYYLGGKWAFLVNWTYWLCWVGGGLSELTAIGLYIHFWFPDIPALMSGVVTLCLLGMINMIAVKWFGELESVFSIIKIIGILLFILLGTGLCIWSFHTQTIGVRENFGRVASLFPFGVKGLLASLPMVLFSFAGVEMIGLTVGETSDPRNNMKKAIDCLPWRILFFYIGTILAILLVVPWQQLDLKESPLVTMLQMIHCQSGAAIINNIVLVASLSSANSAIYSTSRILYDTAKEKRLPNWFSAISSRGVPVHGILFTAGLFFVGLCLHFFVADSRILFQLLAGMTTSCFLFVWSSILYAHIQMVKERKTANSQRIVYRDKLVIAFFCAVGISLLVEPATRFVPLYSFLWFSALLLFYRKAVKENSARE
ncbi:MULTISPECIES: amino acid permease [unclassified Enterococcus]|uniref:amino acid permease n=1 Tax=unclassified Enterococcus TaxID=2608891 RepID=UPI0013ECDBA9|nr:MULTISPECIES: amino acid permease [unclassified Enterococcus]